MATTPSVDANYRFIAANQELNVRINQRQQALALYVTMIVSLLAALVALKPTESKTIVPAEWLMLGFPVASICLGFLNYKAELVITNLRRFLSTLERLNDMHLSLPSYNTHAEWAMGANKARRFHDYATALLVFGGNAIGIAAAYKIYPQRISENTTVFVLSIVISLVAVFAILASPRWGFVPESE